MLLFIGSYFPDLLCVKHLIGILILVYSFQICVYYFCEFANKSTNQEMCSKTFISRMLIIY